ncbi:hypothetical protein [Phormidium sp. CCY1219]|jgi:hypothetical protein|uniref:hypothetical protein n=1 Tax=Phormidium sp. CCY1219 TaxID=2886104 RepID=UPI002D1F375A|nr:hypothetical protein [Phormidium sp. CCY1219]MEB3827538.1 hypothetical protein [Phormidium sp. CCY1219]
MTSPDWVNLFIGKNSALIMRNYSAFLIGKSLSFASPQADNARIYDLEIPIFGAVIAEAQSPSGQCPQAIDSRSRYGSV